MADDILNVNDSPVQAGVQYESCIVNTFEGGTLVPVADSWSQKEVAEGEATKNNENITDNYSAEDSHLVFSGDVKIKKGSTLPNKGDLITEDVTNRNFVVTGDPEVTGFSKSKPIMGKLELTFFPAIDAAPVPAGGVVGG